MQDLIAKFNSALDKINGVIWHDIVLYVVLAVGVLFTLWSGFCQYRSLTHGVAVTRGKYDDKKDPGAINHFQALSTALSATVGLGNIGGVALAISLGGPGAVFWMWVVGAAGMALKTTEVTLAMLYRNTDNPEEPHGGAMWVASKGFKKWGLGAFGKIVGGIFCLTLIISAVTGGNMFQAWNVADITENYFDVPQIATGIVMALLTGAVIIGGIKRIGSVTGRMVPMMCGMYLIAALYVILMNVGEVPAMLKLIVVEAFQPTKAEGAFLGGTAGYAFLWGMKRALFSNEAGQGSSPIAHSAAKTDEPAREGVVAGLEPFIDTIVVCTLTTLVILLTGVWNRGPDVPFVAEPASRMVAEGVWSLERTELKVDKPSDDISEGADVFVIVRADGADEGNINSNTGLLNYRLKGKIAEESSEGRTRYFVDWADTSEFPSRAGGGLSGGIELAPESAGASGAHFDFKGATLTAKAFDSTVPGLGKWLVTIAAWLFAISTMISWSYYGEQGVVFLAGVRFTMPYRIVYCLLIVVATIPSLVKNDAQLDNLTSLGTGLMLWANIPIMLMFGAQAMRAYKQYFTRMRAGGYAEAHASPPLADVVEGKDVE